MAPAQAACLRGAFTAFLETLTPESTQKVTLVYGARTPELFLFPEMILDIRTASDVENFDRQFDSEWCVPRPCPYRRVRVAML